METTTSPAPSTPADLTFANGRVLVGSCLDRLKELPDNSVDSVVTDPPYEIAFMGRSWDNAGIAFDPAVWAECLRVLKPGGHLLAFGATRTYHRIAVAIEDAGFEIRDSIHWTYGSGFPKSLDVSKAIDKLDAAAERTARALEFTAWMRSTGLTAKRIDELTGTNMGGHFTTAASQPAVATAELFDLLRPHVGEVPARIEELVAQRTVESQNFKAREVVGVSSNGIAGGSGLHAGQKTYGFGAEFDVTAPATDAARTWSGWGTALKPSHEPIVVARKPLAGTVAATVLEHGTGALNIDASRVGAEGGTKCVRTEKHSDAAFVDFGGEIVDLGKGRWPANTILTHSWGCEYGCMDGCPVAELDRQSNGGASRFFTQTSWTEADLPRALYVAKPSKKERNAGTDGNAHPTVKPVELMRHLITLVTPPGGTVVDPFLGSGTTAVAATLAGFQFVGVELTTDYLDIIAGRIRWAAEQVAQ